MQVLLLGTGSADGWPNPWCRCASCQWARRAGELRARTAALVSGRVLIDPGPDVGLRASAGGYSLADVEAVLITHGHPDHLDPSFLLARAWALTSDGPPRRLMVAGPPDAIDLARPWVGPDAPIDFVAVAPGDRLECGGLQVLALPAAHSLSGGRDHDGTALLYELAEPATGHRMLWATDTADIPHGHLTGRYDLVAMDETFGEFRDHGSAHLDLVSFAANLQQLRRAGHVDDGSRVIAIHMSHHNPPDVAARLAGIGAAAGRDLQLVRLGVPDPGVLPRRVFVTGGARSGKSQHAESLARGSGRQVIYVATAPGYPEDPEWVARVAAHRARRPGGWQLSETADLVAILAAAAPDQLLLVDCLTLWLTRVLDDCGGWGDPEAGRREAQRATDALVQALSRSDADVILVSNEVGSGVVPETASGRLFRDLLGRANTAVAAACTQVDLLVSGVAIPLRKEADPREGPEWSTMWT